jgi:hypothetical protein
MRQKIMFVRAGVAVTNGQLLLLLASFKTSFLKLTLPLPIVDIRSEKWYARESIFEPSGFLPPGIGSEGKAFISEKGIPPVTVCRGAERRPE